MTQYFDLIQRILDASNRGLDIITDCCPAAAKVVNNTKKAFRLRDLTSSLTAVLQQPKL